MVCNDCPFRLDQPINIFTWSSVARLLYLNDEGKASLPPWRDHSCHKTDPKAIGYVEGYTGGVKLCQGHQWLKQGGLPFLVHSEASLLKLYGFYTRKASRWDRKKLAYAKKMGYESHLDDEFNYITHGAGHCHFSDKASFFERCKEAKALGRELRLEAKLMIGKPYEQALAEVS